MVVILRKLLPVLVLAAALPAAAAPAPDELARLAAEVDNVQDWSARAAIEIISADGDTRRRRARLYNRLRDNAFDMLRLYHFEAPADIEGTGLLLHENTDGEDDIWLYLPAIGRSRRIVADDKKNSFVGTEFAFIDLMTQRVNDYEHTVIDGQSDAETLVLESIPLSEDIARDIGYSRQLAWVDRQTHTTSKIEYYDLDGERLKTQFISDYRAADTGAGKWIAANRRMVNHRNQRETVIRLTRIKINQSVPEHLFAPSRLGRH